MERERACCGTGGRVLCDTEPWPEHACLPASTVAREAVDTVRAEGLEALEVRPERDDLVLRAQRDVDVRNAVVVELDRQLRRNTECGEQLVGVLERRHRRQRLLHPAEADPRALTLEADGDGPALRLDSDLDELQRRGEHERSAE